MLSKSLCSNCDFEHEFSSSPILQNGSLDVNKRMVCAMRAIGQGHGGMETLCMLMNMPKPLTPNNYNKIVNQCFSAAQDIAEKTMSDAVNELC